jgi:Raf kinase inhibitor-like YbhB/YbcL family protein
MKRVLLLVLFTACGGDDGGSAAIDAAPPGVDASTDAPASIDAPAGALALTSPSLTEGAAIDPAFTCNGANTSPQLDWTGAPAGAQSFAVVLTDKSNNLVHWVIFDVPAAATGLPANVEKVFAPGNVAGAHQTASYDPQVRGYNGPCPPAVHTYEFKLIALDVAALPGATMQTSRAQAVSLIGQHDLATATLTGTYTP